MRIRVGILTVSDGCVRGDREDISGTRIVEWCERLGHEVTVRASVPDETAVITPSLLEWADELEVDVVLTTGGTGFTDRDVTPEATRSVIEREAPGIAEEIRRKGASATAFAMLSRGLSGVRGRTLIVNLPGVLAGSRMA